MPSPASGGTPSASCAGTATRWRPCRRWCRGRRTSWRRRGRRWWRAGAWMTMNDEYSSGSDDETIIIDFDGAGCCGRRYAVLTEQKIRQELSLEAAMTAEELSVPEDWALALLFQYRWRAYDLQHDWESDQAAVRDAVGLPGAGDTAPDRDDEEDKETTMACGICLEARPAAAMASAGCAHRFCHGGCGSIVCAPPCSYRFCWRASARWATPTAPASATTTARSSTRRSRRRRTTRSPGRRTSGGGSARGGRWRGSCATTTCVGECVRARAEAAVEGSGGGGGGRRRASGAVGPARLPARPGGRHAVAAAVLRRGGAGEEGLRRVCDAALR
ncbi:hypothetical protein SEVIR_6G252150v4 [Setaria viridis]